MNEEKQIRYSKYLVISFALIAVLIIFFKLFCGGTSGNNNDVQGTVQRVQDDNQRAGAALDGVRDEISAAGAELAGADRHAERAEGIARQNAETIRSCREILERSKAAHQRAKQILADVERSNETGEVQK